MWGRVVDVDPTARAVGLELTAEVDGATVASATATTGLD
jgi:hypothetical protein